MNFNINGELLELSFRMTGGFRMWIPKGWPHLSKTAMIEELQLMNEEPFDPKPQLVALYEKDENGALLRITMFGEAMSRTIVDGAIAQRSSHFKDTGATVRLASFLHNGCEMDQIIVADEETVRVQLFVCHPQSPVYMLEFIVARAAHADEAPAIESAIGTISVEPGNQAPMGKYRDGQ